MTDMNTLWPWLSLLALGAFHGLNPAMGWLFAVSLGLQERRLRAVTAALGPIAAGHALAISLAVVVAGVLGLVIPQRLLLALGGAVLLAFAGYKILTRFRHPRWIGMRVSSRELVLWSFLMASAHGAGLMLVPVLIGLREEIENASTHAEHLGHLGHTSVAGGETLLPALVAVGLHAAAMLAASGVIAVIVYQKVGVEVLRRAWVNLDLVWVGALAVTGSIAIGLGLISFLTN